MNLWSTERLKLSDSPLGFTCSPMSCPHLAIDHSCHTVPHLVPMCWAFDRRSSWLPIAMTSVLFSLPVCRWGNQSLVRFSMYWKSTQVDLVHPIPECKHFMLFSNAWAGGCSTLLPPPSPGVPPACPRPLFRPIFLFHNIVTSCTYLPFPLLKQESWPFCKLNSFLLTEIFKIQAISDVFARESQ